ncbi:protein rep, partial [Solibacillus sp. NPDC093137]|uniref:protein rep n=1 Tax=Solibacillus sp. NPDC093137 TaxID=3390678 RepID=UPI003CFEAC15
MKNIAMTRVSNALAQKQIDEKIRRVRAERYACQSVAKLALPKERVSICLRRPVSSEVEIWKHKQTKKAFYSGLMVCGSVWICPVCAAKISERRKTELELAFEQHKKNNGQIALLTLTFAHKKSDKLKDTLKKFSAATQKMMTGRAFHDIRLQMDMLGRIRVFEVTYGANGFHPHVHIALLYKNADVDLEQIKSKMYDLWSKACIKNGLTSNKKYGLDLQS